MWRQKLRVIGAVALAATVSGGFTAASLGCSGIYDEVLHPPQQAAGAVLVAIDQNPSLQTTALATGTAEPLNIDGATASVTFDLVAADDVSGATALSRLVVVNSTSDLIISPTGRNKMEVHTDGSGCVSDGVSGHVHLVAGDTDKLSGDFILSGTVAGDTTKPCTITGTMANIPLVK